MKKILFSLTLLVCFAFPSFAGDLDSSVVDHLQKISLTIETPRGSGSGVIKTRKRGDKNISFVWTGAHVVDHLRHIKSIIDGKTGTERTVVEFDDAKSVKTLVEDGRTIGRIEIFSQVIRFSKDEDLALLRIRQVNFTTESVRFYLDEKLPHVGTSLCHVGSILGEQLGGNSFTTGVMSAHGRLLDGHVFDQTTVMADHGSSGGGVFLFDGRLVGLVLQGTGQSMNYIAPARRIVKFARDGGIAWAVDDSVTLPTDEELKKLVIEDNGIVFPASPVALPDKKSSKKLFQEKKSITFGEFFLNGLPQ